MEKKHLILDKVFSEKKGLTEHTFDIYKKIYGLKKIVFNSKISKGLFEYVKNRKYFILLCIYDQDGRIYLKRSIQEELYWELPGGSISKTETIHDAVRKISKRITENIGQEIVIGELEPVAIVKNNFKYNEKIYTHEGMAFIARIRNKEKINTKHDLLGSFVHVTKTEINSIKRFANKEVVKLCQDRLKMFSTEFPEIEISTNEKYKWRYVFHNNFIKKFILTPRIKRKKDFLNNILNKIGNAKTVIDVSCGDSDLINEIIKNSNSIEYVVGNDISWSQVDLINNKDVNVIFTNHNAVYLPFLDNIFDVSFCGNTLHHMQSKEELLLLIDSLFRISNKIIIVEIEKPKETGWFPNFLNKYYYINFLKDVGGAYLSKNEFKSILSSIFKNKANLKFSNLKNIQGNYMIAEIEKKDFILNDNVIEVEEKFYCGKADEIIASVLAQGFELKKTLVENDEYFTDFDGEYIRNRTCLRIRSDSNNKMEVTFKGKSANLSSQYAKVENNIYIDKNAYFNQVNLLHSLGYYKYIDVHKNRKYYSKKDGDIEYNFLVDKLPKVGSFIEFEILTKNLNYTKTELKEKLELFVSKHKKNLEKADLPYRDFVARYYSEKIFNKKKLKGILIDLDGTLIPSEKVFFESWQKVFKTKFNCNFTINEYIENELEKDNCLIDYLKKEGKINFKNKKDEALAMDKVYKEYSSKFEEMISDDENLLSIKLLEQLKKDGYKLALVTTSKRVFVDKFLDKVSARNIFDAVVTREDVENHKPAPDAYKKALEILNLTNEKCLAVEDSKRGYEAAKKAGLNCILVKNNTIVLENIFKNENITSLDSFLQFGLILKYSY